MLNIFSYVSGPSVCLPWRIVCSSPLPIFLIGLFVFLECSRVSSLYILEIRPLSEVSLANMFSHTVGSLCNLVLFSLALQKLFILMRSHLFILSFMSLAKAHFFFYSAPHRSRGYMYCRFPMAIMFPWNVR